MSSVLVLNKVSKGDIWLYERSYAVENGYHKERRFGLVLSDTSKLDVNNPNTQLYICPIYGSANYNTRNMVVPIVIDYMINSVININEMNLVEIKSLISLKGSISQEYTTAILYMALSNIFGIKINPPAGTPPIEIYNTGKSTTPVVYKGNTFMYSQISEFITNCCEVGKEFAEMSYDFFSMFSRYEMYVHEREILGQKSYKHILENMYPSFKIEKIDGKCKFIGIKVNRIKFDNIVKDCMETSKGIANANRSDTEEKLKPAKIGGKSIADRIINDDSIKWIKAEANNGTYYAISKKDFINNIFNLDKNKDLIYKMLTKNYNNRINALRSNVDEKDIVYNCTVTCSYVYNIISSRLKAVYGIPISDLFKLGMAFNDAMQYIDDNVQPNEVNMARNKNILNKYSDIDSPEKFKEAIIDDVSMLKNAKKGKNKLLLGYTIYGTAKVKEILTKEKETIDTTEASKILASKFKVTSLASEQEKAKDVVLTTI